MKGRMPSGRMMSCAMLKGCANVDGSAMKVASTHEDVCGLRIDAAHLAWTGGSSYLHRRAPLYMPGTGAEARHFNYAIVRPGSGAEVISAEPGLELVRLPFPCLPDDGYSWRLP